MIDTHLHLWDPHRFRYPWLEEFPPLNRNFMLSEYIETTAGSGIQGSLLVECAAGPDSFVPETHWILKLASDPAARISGVVASIRPEREDFSVHLESFAGHPLLKGVRRTLHNASDDLSRSLLFRENLRRLAEASLSFDLCVLERQIPLAIALVDACPEITFVLDHCGIPDIAANTPQFWRKQISEFARRPNTICKISGLLLYAAEAQRTAEGIFPWFDHVLASFGWTRVIWGSDWPVCTLAVSLLRWVRITHQLLDIVKATPAQRAALLHQNAKRVYRL